MAKNFMYFEVQEGGMENHEISDLSKFRVYGWMNESCKSEDELLLKWTETAKVGEYFDHRMGVMVRLRDI